MTTLTRLLLCWLIVGLTTTAAAQSLPPLEIFGRQGEYYWVVETAADGSRRGGWVSAQIPIDLIDRAALKPIPALGSVQPAPPPAVRLTVPVAPVVAPASAATQAPLPPTDQLPARGLSQIRRGVWFNGGLGVGWASCEFCIGRLSGAALDLSLGGTINRRTLLGGGISAWARSDGITGLAGEVVDARFRAYPVLASGFYITTGFGLGIVAITDELSEGRGFVSTVTSYGPGGVIGVGWDVRVGRNVSLTPFYTSFWLHTPLSGWAGSDQVGLSVTVH